MGIATDLYEQAEALLWSAEDGIAHNAFSSQKDTVPAPERPGCIRIDAEAKVSRGASGRTGSILGASLLRGMAFLMLLAIASVVVPIAKERVGETSVRGTSVVLDYATGGAAK